MLALRPALAARVQVHLETVHAEAAAMIWDHIAAVSAVADALVAARSLTGAEITELVARHPWDPRVSETGLRPLHVPASTAGEP